MAHAILGNPVASAIGGADKSLWLTVYHKKIGKIRNSIRREALPPANLIDDLAKVLDEAHDVFSKLLQALLRQLDEEEESDEAATCALGSDAMARRFLALLCELKDVEEASAAEIRAACARCLVYLGDVARYRRMHLRPPLDNDMATSPAASAPVLLGSHHTEWREAARCYHRALLISTTNAGSAHNQLAVLSQTEADRPFAIMHYLCALSVTRPFEVARDNLLAFVGKATGSSSDGVGGFGGGGGPGGGGTLGGVGITSNLRGGVPAPKSLLRAEALQRQAAQAKDAAEAICAGLALLFCAPRGSERGNGVATALAHAAGSAGGAARPPSRSTWTHGPYPPPTSLDQYLDRLGRVVGTRCAEGGETDDAEEGKLPLRLVQPLLISAVCAVHRLYRRGGGDGSGNGDELDDGAALALDALLGLIFALHSRLPPTQARSDSAAGAHDSGFALLAVLDADDSSPHSGEGAAAMPARTVPPDGALRGAAGRRCQCQCQVLCGLLPAVSYLSGAPSMLRGASSRRLEQLASALITLRARCGGDELGVSGGEEAEATTMPQIEPMDLTADPPLTPLHLCLLGLSPFEASLATLGPSARRRLRLTQGGRHDESATSAAKAGSGAGSTNVHAHEEGSEAIAAALQTGMVLCIRKLATSRDTPESVREALVSSNSRTSVGAPIRAESSSSSVVFGKRAAGSGGRDEMPLRMPPPPCPPPAQREPAAAAPDLCRVQMTDVQLHTAATPAPMVATAAARGGAGCLGAIGAKRERVWEWPFGERPTSPRRVPDGKAPLAWLRTVTCDK